MTVTAAQASKPLHYDRTKVLITVPTHNGQIWTGCAGGIATVMAAGRAGGMYFHVQGSAINQVRNEIASQFLAAKKFDVLVCIDADIQFDVEDFDYLMEGDEIIATAEYCRKQEEYKPITFGMGFVRIHRKVFETLDELTSEGTLTVGTYYKDGKIMRDYFRTGASSDARWMSEDFGFWSLVHLAGIKPKVEKRTRLVHWGMKGYAYRHDSDFGAQ